MPNPELIAHDKWMAGTSRLLHVRSRELKALDDALKKYTAAPSQSLFTAVSKAFDTWKASKGPGDRWKQTSRDGNQMFTLLDNQLRGLGDTDRALGVVDDFMATDAVHARLGAVYLFSRLECDEGLFSVALEGALDLAASSLEYADIEYNPLPGVVGSKAEEQMRSKAVDLTARAERSIRARDGTQKTVKSAQLFQTVPPPTSERLRRIWIMIRDAVLEFAAKIIAAIKEKLDGIRAKVMTIANDPGDAIIDVLPTLLRKLVDALTSRFLASAAPFIGASLDVAKGIVNTLDAGVTKFQEWLSSREVVLASGHITVIVESIKRAMWMSVGKGLYDLLKGGLKLGLEFASYGAGAIVTLVQSIVEAVVKTVWKMIEVSRLRKFFDEARELWATHKDPGALHTRPIAFNQWLKAHSLMLPVLPVLALNTGVTGNKMLFLQMYQSDNRVVSQSQFDKGVTYLDGLKDWGSTYLKECGFSFSSADKTVTGLLSMAKNQAAPLTAKGKVWKGVQKFLG